MGMEALFIYAKASMLFHELPYDAFFSTEGTGLTYKFGRKLDDTKAIVFIDMQVDGYDGYFNVRIIPPYLPIVPIRDADGRERLRQFQGR